MKHILRDEHDDLGNDLPGGPVAWRVGSQVFQQEHLAKLHSGGVRKPVEPLHLHADPAEVGEIKKHNAELLGEVDTLTAEVERLRYENEALACNLRGKHELTGATYQHLVQERDTLRAQLAEQNALLHKALADVEYIQKECGGDVSPGYIGCLVDDVVNLLSASAERNQCDGCQAGIPSVNGIHRMGKPGGYSDSMACQASKYAKAEPRKEEQ